MISKQLMLQSSLHDVPEQNYHPEGRNVRIDASSGVNAQAAKFSHDNKKEPGRYNMGSESKNGLFIDSFVRSQKAQPDLRPLFCWGKLYIDRVW